jgi:hypothetical protein
LIPLRFFTKGTGVTLLELQKLSSVFQNDLSAVREAATRKLEERAR